MIKESTEALTPNSLLPQTNHELASNQEYVEITHGLPFSNAQAFFDHLWNSFYERGIIRFPIIGFKQPGGEVRVFMLLKNSRDGKQSHASLLERLGLHWKNVEDDKDKGDIAFTTSIEFHTPIKPQSEYDKRNLYLALNVRSELDEEQTPYYVMVGRGSDLDIPQLTSLGEAWLASIMKPLGIELKSTNPNKPILLNTEQP
jgi:hypothetical protein